MNVGTRKDRISRYWNQFSVGWLSELKVLIPMLLLGPYLICPACMVVAVPACVCAGRGGVCPFRLLYLRSSVSDR